ncbi:hypothetical protein M9H77_24463 [Catharanthus roseus]|uniref:Uncharacterized protein n=1 Tax=Catharanthus roseus TaxID=4058 RepID=A0ACC0AW97_CATRO|nr:hypothetical protein M9H77_24463 [Catharanthus roseus]
MSTASAASSKTTTTTTTKCLFVFLISFYIINLAGGDYTKPIFPIAAAFLIAALIIIILAVRTTIVTWITVLVLLAFAGNRRRVLVKNGRKITSEVAMDLVKVVIIRERGIAVVACAATVASLMAIAWLRKLV